MQTLKMFFKSERNLFIAGLLLVGFLSILTILTNFPSFTGYFYIFGLKLFGFYRVFEVFKILAAVIVVLLFISYFDVKLPKVVNKLVSVALILISLVTLFLSFQIPGAKRIYYFDTSDTFHYFLMPKYADEISYYDVYKCSLVAVEELGLWKPKWFRKLEDTSTIHVKEALNPKNRKYCHGLFSSERWQEFREDHTKYDIWARTRGHYNRFHDQGYNGTPVRTFFTYSIANIVDLSEYNLTKLSLSNLIFVVGMYILVVLAFGWRAAAVFCLLCSINYADRYFLGGAFLRYTWLPTLIAGFCFLKMNRYGYAAVFLCLSAFMQIFPVLFLLGVGLKILFDWYNEKQLSPNYLKFIKSATITSLVLLLLSVSVGKGIDNWTTFFDKMSVHSDRFASGRIGFKYNFVFPKERNKGLTPYEPKLEEYARTPVFLGMTKQTFYRLSVLIIVIGILGLIKHLSIIEFGLLFGFSLFFLSFSTVNYYYSGWLGLPLLFYQYKDQWQERIYQIILLLVMIYIFQNMNRVSYHYLFNSVFSMAFSCLIVGVIGYLYIFRIGMFNRKTNNKAGSTSAENVTRDKNVALSS